MKTSKALERQQFITAQLEIKRKTLQAFQDKERAKHKRKQPVNPNLSFITIGDIERNTLGPAVPLRASNTTIKIQDDDETVPTTALSLKDVVGTVTSHLFHYQAI